MISACDQTHGGFVVCLSVQLSQQEALGKVSGLEETVAQLRLEVDQLHEQLQERKDDLVTQRAVNQQLMLKKEEVEWQLMAALAKVRGRCSGWIAFYGGPALDGHKGLAKN